MNEENVNLNEEVKEMTIIDKKQGRIKGLEDIGNNTHTILDGYTNIKDQKKLYNIENGEVDGLLNDCVGERLRIKGVVIKIYTKELEKPVIDETTGEITQDVERKMTTILVDDNDRTYATGSKMFAIQLMRFIQNYGFAWEDEGLEIEIIKKKTQNNGNKALGFKLV